MEPNSSRARRAAALRSTLSLAAFIALWWLGAVLAGSPQLLPSPADVLIVAWRELASGAMLSNIGITLLRVSVAFSLSMIVGSTIGYLAGRSVRGNAYINPWLIISLNMPVLLVIILVYIWIGLNETAAVLAVIIAKTPTVIVTIREGTRALDRGLEDVAAVFHLPLLRRMRRIVLPQLSPYMAAAGRSGLSITWKIVLIVELLGRPNGVGFEMNLFFQSFNVAGVLAYGLAFAAIMLIVETTLLQPWEQRANAWRRP